MGEKMDSEREAFEKWANDNGYKLFDLVPDDDRYNRKRRGQYKDHMVELAWEVWQARAHITQPAQAVDVDEAMVERMAKWMCRHEIPSLASMDEVLWRMGNWRRYVDEARSALTAALPKDSNGKESPDAAR